MLSYAYGLCLRTSHPVPGLVSASDNQFVDAEVFLGGLPTWAAASEAECPWYTSPAKTTNGIPTLQVWKLVSGEFYKFRYSDDTEFLIDRQGARVWCAWPDNLTLEDTATYLLGPVMGFVLLLRGTICLHASAIAVGDRAIAIAGFAEAGKSTTAATFAKLGYPVLADDVVTLQEFEGNFLVQPAYPSIRLWPDSVEALYGSLDALPRITPTILTWQGVIISSIINHCLWPPFMCLATEFRIRQHPE